MNYTLSVDQYWEHINIWSSGWRCNNLCKLSQLEFCLRHTPLSGMIRASIVSQEQCPQTAYTRQIVYNLQSGSPTSTSHTTSLAMGFQISPNYHHLRSLTRTMNLQVMLQFLHSTLVMSCSCKKLRPEVCTVCCIKS